MACLSCHDANQAFSVTRSGYDHPFGVPYRGALPMAEREQALEQAKASGAPVNAARQLKYDQDFRPAARARTRSIRSGSSPAPARPAAYSRR